MRRTAIWWPCDGYVEDVENGFHSDVALHSTDRGTGGPSLAVYRTHDRPGSNDNPLAGAHCHGPRSSQYRCGECAGPCPYAFEDTRLAFILNLPFQVLGVIGFAVCGLLPPQWVVVGIGLVMTLTNTGAAFLLGYALRGKMGRIDGKRILITHLKLLAISLVVGLIGILAMRWATGVFHPEASFMSSVLVMIVLAPILTIMYFGLMKLWKMPELVSLEGPARGVLRKLGINK